MIKSELLELAKRVEALEGPDREVDAGIAMLVMARLGASPPKGMTPVDYLARFPSLCEEYTASLDAAMSLVPIEDGEPWLWSVSGGGKSKATADVFWDTVEGVFVVGVATPALALCAAALRALAERQSDD